MGAHRGAVAGVPEACRGDGAEVDVAHHERLLELRRPGDHLAVLVDRDAAPVEDELVLAPDQVAEQDGGQVVAGALHQHLLALVGLPGVIGRRGEVHDHLRARQRLGAGRRPRLPDVLADGQADRRPVQPEQRGLLAGLEVAVLVEDAVVRQEHLPVDRGDPAP